METRSTPTLRLDGLDAERFREMLESATFKLLLDRMRQQLERERETTERSDSEVAIWRAQGAIRAWRTALAVPEQILQEIQRGAYARSK